MNPVQPYLFWILAIATGLSAVATVVTQNIVRSATWLLFTLSGTAGVFFLLGADLVGGVQILVYVGGTLVLVVFGVMLTAQGPFINMKASSAEWAISAVVASLLLTALIYSVAKMDVLGPPTTGQKEMAREYGPKKPLSETVGETNAQQQAKSPYSEVLGQGFLGVGVGPAHKGSEGPLRMTYLLPFELVSIHLLVVLIGAAYLGRAKRRRPVAS